MVSRAKVTSQKKIKEILRIIKVADVRIVKRKIEKIINQKATEIGKKKTNIRQT